MLAWTPTASGERRRGDDVLGDRVDEVGERLLVGGGPIARPLVVGAAPEQHRALPSEHRLLEARQLVVEDRRAVRLGGLRKVAVRVLGRAVERDQGVENDVWHVESFRDEEALYRSDRLCAPNSSR
jgi:hypothetical protein